MPTSQHVLVTGGTGFIGRALIPALLEAGQRVRATTRHQGHPKTENGVEWLRCDVERRADLARALEGVDAAYFLVHGMGQRGDYTQIEHRSAQNFRDVCAAAGVKRIVYLGGVAPEQSPSKHLQSRLHVGEILRGGTVPALELRASMVIGNGSESWRIVRDLALRLPAMVLPKWSKSRTRPIAIQDVIVALVRGLDLPLPHSAWYDIPGPDTVSGRELLEGIAAVHGRRVPSITVPLLSTSLSSWWLKLVTRADMAIARELVLGLEHDLLPKDERYWAEIDYQPQWTFRAAAQHALEAERTELTVRGVTGKLEEKAVQLLGPKL